MNRFKRILAAIDTRRQDHPIVGQSADLARHAGAHLTIVDVVPELPWLVRATLEDSDALREALVADKMRRLEAIAEPLRRDRLDVDTRVLEGKTSVAIIRDVLRHGHDLVMRVAKGASSRREGFFGTTAFRLLRKCPCPVWLVRPDPTSSGERVLGCVNPSPGDRVDEELNDQVIELAQFVSRYHKGKCSLIHVWSLWNEPMLAEHMKPEEFDLVKRRAREEVERNFAATLERHNLTLDTPGIHLLEGEPTLKIPEFVKLEHVDLVVLGTVGRSGLQGILMGNTAEQILDRLECSVLAVKPSGFVCPIKLDD